MQEGVSKSGGLLATRAPPLSKRRTVSLDPARLHARPGHPLRGRMRAPGDKSISHRALILGALARGDTEATGLLEGADVLSTAAAMRLFGAEVTRLGPGDWRVRGSGGFREPEDVVDCGNAGTAVRLILGAAAAFPLSATFTGDASLRGRPMGRVLHPLAAMGARTLGRDRGRLPLTLAGGGLRAVDYTPPVASAQVKSAVLLAGLGAEGATSVLEPEPTRDHTERMLRAFGAEVAVAGEANGLRASVTGRTPLSGAAVAVPGDPSSAAFPLVGALLVPGSDVTVGGVLLNPLRTGLYDTLRGMGADLAVEDAREAGGEPVGDLRARAGGLRGVVVPPARAPSMIDEYPILAVAAAFAEGETVMRGIGELRVKESDRIALTVALLRGAGVEVEEEPDGLVVHGRGRPPPGGGVAQTRGDHRIAMSALVLGLAAPGGMAADGAGMIATSFPGFAAAMRALGGDVA